MSRNYGAPWGDPRPLRPEDLVRMMRFKRRVERRDHVRGQNSFGSMPQMPERKWWQYLPILRQGYEDELSKWQTDYARWAEEEKRKYESPQDYMDRLMAAGINPNVGYISGAKAGMQADAPESYRPENFSGGDIQTLAQGALSVATGTANIKNLASMTFLNATKALTEAENQGYIKEHTAEKQISNEIARYTLNDVVQQQALKTEGERIYNQKLNEEIGMILMNKDLNEKEQRLKSAQLNKVSREIELLGHEAEYARMETEMFNSGFVISDGIQARQIYLDFAEGKITEKQMRRRLFTVSTARAANFGVAGVVPIAPKKKKPQVTSNPIGFRYNN